MFSAVPEPFPNAFSKALLSALKTLLSLPVCKALSILAEAI